MKVDYRGVRGKRGRWSLKGRDHGYFTCVRQNLRLSVSGSSKKFDGEEGRKNLLGQFANPRKRTQYWKKFWGRGQTVLERISRIDNGAEKRDKL